MNIYSIYENLQKQDTSPIIIKQGFSFWAAIFNFVWAIYNRMWSFALLGLAVQLIIISSMPQNNLIVSIANISMLFIFGFFATEMQEYYANKRGFKLADIILAKNPEEAELQYFARSF